MLKDKILVVDDEQMIRWTLSESLRGWGYAPVEAETVAASLKAFEAEQPAAVLLDWVSTAISAISTPISRR